MVLLVHVPPTISASYACPFSPPCNPLLSCLPFNENDEHYDYYERHHIKPAWHCANSAEHPTLSLSIRPATHGYHRLKWVYHRYSTVYHRSKAVYHRSD